ncbi:hypothetical protein KFU94_66365 [Chloroflexi bacterium TSY]|nr:hypothetical protein [Chloroflexi bacterium TSY]
MPRLNIVPWQISDFRLQKATDPFNQAVIRWVANQADILLGLSIEAGDNGVEGAKSLAELLGEPWRFRLSPPNANDTKKQDRYALFYRTTNPAHRIKQLELVGAQFPQSSHYDEGREFFNESIFGDARNPYLFALKVNQGRFTFPLLGYHAPSGSYETVKAAVAKLAGIAEIINASYALVAGDFNITDTGVFNPLREKKFVLPDFGPTTIRSCVPSWQTEHLSAPLDRILTKGLSAPNKPPDLLVVDPLSTIAQAESELNKAYSHPIQNMTDALFAYHQLSEHIPIGVTIKWQ